MALLSLYLLLALATACLAETPLPPARIPKHRNTFHFTPDTLLAWMRIKGNFCIAFSPDSRFLAYGKPLEITIWDLHAGKEVRTLVSRDTHELNSVTFTPDGKQLVMVGAHHPKPDPEENEIRFWSLASGKLVRTLHWPGLLAYNIAFRRDGKQFVCGDVEGNVTVWDATTLNRLRTYRNIGQQVFTVGYNSVRKCCAITCGEEDYHFYDVESNKRIASLGPRYLAVIAELSPDSKLLATAHPENFKVCLWDTATGKCVATWRADKRSGSKVEQVCFVPGTKHLIVCQDEKVWAWDPTAKRPLWNIDNPKAFPKRAPFRIHSMGLSPDGKWLATFSSNPDDRWFDLWELPPTKP